MRNIGVQRAVTGSLFFVSISLLSAIGIALVYGVGGYFVIQGTLTIGTIVALGAYLGILYGALQTLTNAPVDFATSMVSFERVFEVLDVPNEIVEKENARVLGDVRGVLEFQDVGFHYTSEGKGLLREVRRFGQMQDVVAVLSGDTTEKQSAVKEAMTTRKAPLSQARSVTKYWSISRSEPSQASWWHWSGPAEQARRLLPILFPVSMTPLPAEY